MWSAMVVIRQIPYKKNNVTYIKQLLDLVKLLQHHCDFQQNNLENKQKTS